MTSRHIRLTFMGNSITRGIDPSLSTSSTGGARKVVWDATQGDYTIQMTGTVTDSLGEWDHHEGWNGYGIGGTGAPSGTYLTDKVANLTTDASDLVVLMAGVNDLTQPTITVPQLTSMADRMGELLDAIHAERPYAFVTVLTLPPINPSNYTSPADDSYRTAYNAALPAIIAARSPWAFGIDVASAYAYATGTYDGIHPNGAGHAALGAAIVSGLTDVSGALTAATSTQLVDGRTLLNSECGEGIDDMRASGGGQHLWFLREVGNRINRSVPALTSVDDSAPIAAVVQRGNWVGRCPTCYETMAVWTNRQLYFSANCWNSAIGNKWGTVTFPPYDERVQIEALLAARPIDNQWWTNESIGALAAENVIGGW